MGIEKMSFIDLTVREEYLEDVLERCILSEMFQPEVASKLSEYSIGSTGILRNPYGGLVVKINDIAAQLDIKLNVTTKPAPLTKDERDAFVEDAHTKLDKMRREYPKLFSRSSKVSDEIMSYTAAQDMLVHINAPNINFDNLWSNKFLKIRFGRLPTQNVSHIENYEGAPFEFYSLDSDKKLTWCVYVTAEDFIEEIDGLFYGALFERLRIPDYVHGNAQDAKSFISDGLVTEKAKLVDAQKEIEAYIAAEKDVLIEIFARAKFLHDAYSLRKYVMTIEEEVHVVGFVEKRNENKFKAFFEDIPDLHGVALPSAEQARLQTPVKLKNNFFVKPFEMFVSMYGLPSYQDIDPTPFVAYTYSLLFGMMFGDLGQGFVLVLIGFYLARFKEMALGKIMTRIGVVSMFFGTLYGSVFGFEHALDGFYKAVFGLSQKPIHVMDSATTNVILLGTVALGAAIIVMVIMFNIIIGIKHKDVERIWLSHNGVPGLVLYLALLTLVFETMTHHEYLNNIEELFLIVVPLLVMFFKEPIVSVLHFKATGQILKEKQLVDTNIFSDGALNVRELFESQFMSVRFGRLPTDSYKKLNFYENEPFMLYPIKSNHDYIWCLYATDSTNKAKMDAIFKSLMFERIFIPDEHIETNEKIENYVKRCVAAGGIPDDEMSESSAKYGPVKNSAPVTLMNLAFPDGIGDFILQTFFEMFEVILSFVTNTMSFLRVGGFILAHAGMMLVVFTLAEMVGAGAAPIVIIIGNVFVMCLEGLIVGIQVLRLEFYEIFSRFFDAEGEPFMPCKVDYISE